MPENWTFHKMVDIHCPVSRYSPYGCAGFLFGLLCAPLNGRCKSRPAADALGVGPHTFGLQEMQVEGLAYVTEKGITRRRKPDLIALYGYKPVLFQILQYRPGPFIQLDGPAWVYSCCAFTCYIQDMTAEY